MLDALADLVVDHTGSLDSDSSDDELGFGGSARSCFSDSDGLGTAEYGQGIGFGGTFGNGEWVEDDDWDLCISDPPVVTLPADIKRIDSRRSAAGNALWWLPTPAVSPKAAAVHPVQCARAPLGHKAKSMVMLRMSRSTSTALGTNSPPATVSSPDLLGADTARPPPPPLGSAMLGTVQAT